MNYKLYQSLHARDLDQKKLAALAGINRSVLARILTNEHGRGKETRHKLFPYLIWKEVQMLGWQDEYQQYVQKIDDEMSAGILRDCRGPCANCSTTNIVPAA